MHYAISTVPCPAARYPCASCSRAWVRTPCRPTPTSSAAPTPAVATIAALVVVVAWIPVCSTQVCVSYVMCYLVTDDMLLLGIVSITNHLYNTCTGVNSGKNGCVHEDGGKLAIFEQISHDEQVCAPAALSHWFCMNSIRYITHFFSHNTCHTVQGDEKRTVAHNVTLGSTYKVVSCNCARDPSLSEVVEWCSWCKCRQCGGKHLPAASKMRFNAHFSGANVSEMHDFSVDLLPLVVLSVVAVVSAYAVLDAPYVYLYALGVVAVAFVVRELSLGAHK